MRQRRLRQDSDDSTAYEVAIDRALAERESVEAATHASRDQTTALEVRSAELADAIAKLIDLLPADRRAAYRRRATFLESERADARGKPVYNNVVQLLSASQRRDWTAPEVRAELSERGIQSEPKQIHNVLNYLARTGQIKRVGRGRYLLMGGIALLTDDEMPGFDPGGGDCE
jgi:hypothetical protein